LGGKEAMEEIIDHLIISKRIGIIHVDGPIGPIGIVKPGAVRIAQKADATIVPTFFISNNFWQLNSWDGFILPKVFSSVTMKFGESLKVDSIKSNQDFETMRNKLAVSMAPYLVRKNRKFGSEHATSRFS